MITEYEKRKNERGIILKECRVTLIISLSMVGSVFVWALIAYLIRTPSHVLRSVQDIWGIFNVIAIVVVIAVLGVRRTIYFSPRLFKNEGNMILILRKWRIIDLVLLSSAELIAILGLVVSLMGMPFGRTFHFFVCGFLLVMILMPIPWKVRDKLRYFEKFAGKLDE